MNAVIANLSLSDQVSLLLPIIEKWPHMRLVDHMNTSLMCPCELSVLHAATSAVPLVNAETLMPYLELMYAKSSEFTLFLNEEPELAHAENVEVIEITREDLSYVSLITPLIDA